MWRKNTVDTVLENEVCGYMFSPDWCECMLARCINESCDRPLYTFAEGRVFQFEVISISLAASDEKSAPFDEKPKRETLHFWLCGRCASKMTLVLEPARGLRLISLDERNANTPEMPIAMEGPPAKEC